MSIIDQLEHVIEHIRKDPDGFYFKEPRYNTLVSALENIVYKSKREMPDGIAGAIKRLIEGADNETAFHLNEQMTYRAFRAHLDVILERYSADKVFVALQEQDGKLQAHVISTVPLTVVVVSEAFGGCMVSAVEAEDCTIVKSPDALREAVFDSLATRIQNKQVDEEMMSALARCLK